MASSSSRVQQFVLHALAPIVCSIGVGFLFGTISVFDRHAGGFQFFWSAVVASVFYYLLIMTSARTAYLGLLVLQIATFVTTQSSSIAFILRDLFYVAGIAMAVFAYVKYSKRNVGPSLFYPAITFAGLYAVSYIVTSEIHLGIIRGLGLHDTGGSFSSLAMICAFYGVTIGFAVGAGISLADRLFGSSQPQTSRTDEEARTSV
jgi:hypothetical protein